MENDNENKDKDYASGVPGGKRGTDDWRPVYFDVLVAYYADPSEQRTLKQWCIDNNLSEDTIHQYKRNHSDTLYAAVDNTRKQYIPKIRIEAYKAVFSNVKKSFQDRKLALQLTGDLVEESKTTVEYKNPEEKRAHAAELLARLSKKMDKIPK